ncbi:hypothetical protein CAEBREN_03401 [Caenorhabditis brenneri]|uniref:DUF7869 domain-containing protein n=1 Tax=Caenorhabditis brenneri TaxID=135651 RepID=G0NEW6_CAEBE|nr:hypothetical protein CAEBREN_03401 [Caenorhabditis brenneri]
MDELLEDEKQFLQMAMPKHAYPSEQILGTECCKSHCVFFLSRYDVLCARHHYINYCNSMKNIGILEYRYLFINTVKRIYEDQMSIVTLKDNVPACPILMARVFGMSYHVFMNALTGPTIAKYKFRPCVTSEYSGTFSMTHLRKRMELRIRERKADSLTRCTPCSVLPEMMKNSSGSHKKEAEQIWKIHIRAISQQRSIIDCLCKQSRDPDMDLTVMLADSMSNKHTKIPQFVSRPKCVGDGDRCALSLTTVQIAEKTGVGLFYNSDYPLLQGKYSHDSSYNISLIIDSMQKLSAIPSKLYLIMDSCRNNKSHVFFGSMGFLLLKIQKLQQITILYPSVGHTHLSVDSHFGTLTKRIREADLMDPKGDNFICTYFTQKRFFIEFATFIADIPSVSNVDESPTIYDFNQIGQFLKKKDGVCSHGQICLSKTNEAASINASLLFGVDNDQQAADLFTDEFDVNSFNPAIKFPEIEPVELTIKHVLKRGGAVFSKDNEKNFHECLTDFGEKSFRFAISSINSKEGKIAAPQVFSDQDPQVTVLEFLNSLKVSQFFKEFIAEVDAVLEVLKNLPLIYQQTTIAEDFKNIIAASIWRSMNDLYLEKKEEVEEYGYSVEIEDILGSCNDMRTVGDIVKERIQKGDIDGNDERFKLIRVEAIAMYDTTYTIHTPYVCFTTLSHIKIIDMELLDYIENGVLNLNQYSIQKYEPEIPYDKNDETFRKLVNAFFFNSKKSAAKFHFFTEIHKFFRPDECYTVECNDGKTLRAPRIFFEIYSDGFDAARRRNAEREGKDPNKFKMDLPKHLVKKLLYALIDPRTIKDLSIEDLLKVLEVSQYWLFTDVQTKLVTFIVEKSEQEQCSIIQQLFETHPNETVDAIAAEKPEILVYWRDFPMSGNYLKDLDLLITKIQVGQLVNPLPLLAQKGKCKERITEEWLIKTFLNEESDKVLVKEFKKVITKWQGYTPAAPIRTCRKRRTV